jgi:hypothetical protein
MYKPCSRVGVALCGVVAILQYFGLQAFGAGSGTSSAHGPLQSLDFQWL